MPRYAKRRTSARKPSYRRRRTSRRRTARRATVSRSRSVCLPDAYITRLKYSTLNAISYVGGTAAPGRYQFRVNSIFDPDLTGTGHQPLGHDEWNTFYNRYCVYGMKYYVCFNNESTTESLEVAVQLRPNSIFATDMQTIREDTLTVYRAILAPQGQANSMRIASGYADVAKIRGISKQRVRMESDYQAVFGNNPPISPILNVYVQNQDVLTSASCNIRVDLVFYVRLYDRKQLTAS